MRIVILGCAGSGKTTLARQLGERTGAPVISLDEVWPGDLQEKDVPYVPRPHGETPCR